MNMLTVSRALDESLSPDETWQSHVRRLVSSVEPSVAFYAAWMHGEGTAVEARPRLEARVSFFVESTWSHRQTIYTSSLPCSTVIIACNSVAILRFVSFIE
jgi:hypothetical protein